MGQFCLQQFFFILQSSNQIQLLRWSVNPLQPCSYATFRFTLNSVGRKCISFSSSSTSSKSSFFPDAELNICREELDNNIPTSDRYDITPHARVRLWYDDDTFVVVDAVGVVSAFKFTNGLSDVRICRPLEFLDVKVLNLLPISFSSWMRPKNS